MARKKDNRVADELRAIYEKRGGLDPKGIVEWARKNTKSALHGRFCWDDTEAARKYREWQAREIITSVTVIYPDQKERQVYVSPVSGRKKTGYKALVDVMSDAQLKAEFLKQALDEYERVGLRYNDLRELSGVRDAVASARRKIAA